MSTFVWEDIVRVCMEMWTWFRVGLYGAWEQRSH
jgi:hypothetical protein